MRTIMPLVFSETFLLNIVSLISQAYTAELEAQVTQLEEENARLLREEVIPCHWIPIMGF